VPGAQQLPVSLSSYPDDAVVSTDVVARILGISKRQVGRLSDSRRGGLRYLRFGPRIRRYCISDVRAYIASRVRGRTTE
jgi:hypothetical protein